MFYCFHLTHTFSRPIYNLAFCLHTPTYLSVTETILHILCTSPQFIYICWLSPNSSNPFPCLEPYIVIMSPISFANSSIYHPQFPCFGTGMQSHVYMFWDQYLHLAYSLYHQLTMCRWCHPAGRFVHLQPNEWHIAWWQHHHFYSHKSTYSSNRHVTCWIRCFSSHLLPERSWRWIIWKWHSQLFLSFNHCSWEHKQSTFSYAKW